MRARLLGTVAAVATAWASLAFAADGPPPGLDLVLAPHGDDYVGVTMTLDDPKLSAGAGLVKLPLILVGIPSARYDGDALTARDDKGPLPLIQTEQPPTPQGVYRQWSTTRATVGDVVVSYKAPPRPVTASTNNGPLFDLRKESGGFMGAGVGFLATPMGEGPYSVNLKWDLADAPAGSRGVWTHGEGDVHVVLPAEALAFSYYGVGPLQSYPAKSDGHFGLFWLSEPPFDAAGLGGKIQSLYAVTSDFWGEKDASYRVFMRQNPYAGRGGSALGPSFMFGYNAESKPTADSLQGLLAHEMAHNWPSMEGEHGDTAWYSEGTAEFYSLLLAHRGGLLTTDQYLEEINERASGYYTNPYRGLTNAAAARIFWSDPTAQTVPYGRGFMYLVQTDGAIRAASDGKHSLDDVVRELRRRQNAGEPYGIAQWLELVGKALGADRAKADYDAMAAGGLLVASPERFAPCFDRVKQTERPFVLGFARASLSKGKISDLEAGSAAAKAGVKDGDEVLSSSPIDPVRKDETVPMLLTLKRDGTELTISYLPRGEPVESYRWTRRAGVADAACKF